MVQNSSTNPATSGNTTIAASSADDQLSGGGGNDTINGLAGNDRLSGDAPLQGQWQYSVYDQNFSSANGQTSLIGVGQSTLIGTGYVNDFNVQVLRNTLGGTPPDQNRDDFGIIYRSNLQITTAGLYTFGTRSDDGSRIIIRDANNNVVLNLNNDFHQSAAERFASANLPVGTYSIEVFYWENAGVIAMSASVQGPGTSAPVTDLATSPLVTLPPLTPDHVDGNDSILGDAGDDTITGGGGNDRLFGGADRDSILGEVGRDYIEGGSGNDTLLGGADSDTLYGGDNDDVVFGGSGNDFLFGGDGLDSLVGDDGDDELSGDQGNDTLLGGIGNDSLDGGSQDDQLFGGTGNDTLRGGDGNDTLEGGAGNDTLLGSAGDDSLNGQADNDRLLGEAGNDTLLGEGGDDSLEGGADNDQLFGGAGMDSLSGGDGNDSLSGGDDSDRLFGDGGNDSLSGDLGNDTLDGGANADLLFGGAGIDSIEGGTGNDTIFGGVNDDSLFGGAGNDLFGYATGDVQANNPEIEYVFGGGLPNEPITSDFDVLDLSIYGQTYGWASVVITYSSNPEDGSIRLYSGIPAPDNSNFLGSIRFDDIERIIRCFTPGTMILTDRGEVAVENLSPGDMVVTHDAGLQPLRWVGRQQMTRARLLADPDLQPVRIAVGALGAAGPSRTMLVSPQHRVLVTGARAELLFGEAEVLVPAKHLIGQAEVTRALPEDGVTYIHILFDRHEIVQSDGIWSESFQPAARALTAMEADVRDEILKIFPELATDAGAYDCARPSLKSHEAKVLFAG